MERGTPMGPARCAWSRGLGVVSRHCFCEASTAERGAPRGPAWLRVHCFAMLAQSAVPRGDRRRVRCFARLGVPRGDWLGVPWTVLKI